MSKTKVKVVFNHFPEIARQLPELTHELLEETADKIAEETRAHAPVAAEAHYAKTRKGSKKRYKLVQPGRLKKSIKTKVNARGSKAWVRVKQFYGYFLEYGTVKMAARPFLTPAAEKMRPWFIERCKDMLGRLGK